MLVQIATLADEPPRQREGIVAAVGRAAREVFGIDTPLLFVHAELAQHAACDQAGDVRVAVLILAAERFGARAKRMLFGRIAELFAQELNLRRDEIIIGVVETSEANWSTPRHGERRWLWLDPLP